MAGWERARKDCLAAFTRERKLEDDLGLETNETTLLDVAFVGAALPRDIQGGFLPLDFFVEAGAGARCRGYVDVAFSLLVVALRSAISLRMQISNFDTNGAIDSIPFSP